MFYVAALQSNCLKESTFFILFFHISLVCIIHLHKVHVVLLFLTNRFVRDVQLARWLWPPLLQMYLATQESTTTIY